MNTDERLLRVMTTVRHGLAEQIFDAIEDEESAQDAQELRREVARLERQCAELCELLPHNANKYQWQLGEEMRAIEKRVEVKMKQFPWNFIHEHYFECLRLKTKA
jgi:hypothetical protein